MRAFAKNLLARKLRVVAAFAATSTFVALQSHRIVNCAPAEPEKDKEFIEVSQPRDRHPECTPLRLLAPETFNTLKGDVILAIVDPKCSSERKRAVQDVARGLDKISDVVVAQISRNVWKQAEEFPEGCSIVYLPHGQDPVVYQGPIETKKVVEFLHSQKRITSFEMDQVMEKLDKLAERRQKKHKVIPSYLERDNLARLATVEERLHMISPCGALYWQLRMRPANQDAQQPPQSQSQSQSESEDLAELHKKWEECMHTPESLSYWNNLAEEFD